MNFCNLKLNGSWSSFENIIGVNAIISNIATVMNIMGYENCAIVIAPISGAAIFVKEDNMFAIPSCFAPFFWFENFTNSVWYGIQYIDPCIACTIEIIIMVRVVPIIVCIAVI